MRALHTRKRYVFLLVPFLLFAVLLLGMSFLLTTQYAEADNFSYIAADVTYDASVEAETILPNTGTELPLSLVYRGGDSYKFGFKLYRSNTASNWELASESLCQYFELRFVGSVSSQPTGVAKQVVTYTAQVIAKEYLSGYRFIENDQPVKIMSGYVIAEKTFSIVPENVSLFVPPIDEVTSPKRTDTLCADILGQANVILGNNALTKDVDYQVVVCKLGEDTPLASIDESGAYYLKVEFNNTAATAALSSTALTEPYVLIREFTVSDPSTSFTLNHRSIYVDDDANNVVKTDVAGIGLSSEISGVAYSTSVWRKVTDDVAAYYSYVKTESSNRYKGLAIGEYVYRITFSSDKPEDGIRANDVVDLPFIVKDTPYSISFKVNNDYYLDTTIVKRKETEQFILLPSFSVTGNGVDSSVFVSGEVAKYSVSYYKYSAVGVLDTAHPLTTLTDIGCYQVVVALNNASSDAVQIADYSIKQGTELVRKDFCIVAGSMRVRFVNPDGVFYYTNKPISPLKFTLSTGETIDPALLVYTPNSEEPSVTESVYSVKYYDVNGDEVEGDLKNVGHYNYILTITKDVSTLGISEGQEYYGEFDIVYPPFSVMYDKGVVSLGLYGENDPVQIVKGTDYDITYYTVSNDILLHKLGVTNEEPHPSGVGTYAAIIAFKTDSFVNYNIHSDDEAVVYFTKSESEITIGIATRSSDLIYDGGAKVPTVTFSKGGTPIVLEENVDYSVTYLWRNGSLYQECGYPVYTGTYKCVVTFLRTNAEVPGVVRGVYKSQAYDVKPLSVNVVRVDRNDFVYDADPKLISVQLKINDRPTSLAYRSAYTFEDAPVVSPVNVGVYGVNVSLDFGSIANEELRTLVSGSYKVENTSYSLEIKPLKLGIRFDVATGYNAMYTGTEKTPSISYLVKNGPNASETPVSVASWSTVLNVAYSPVASPIDPGVYTCTVSSLNDNIVLIEAMAYDEEEHPLPDYTEVKDGVAELSYWITPCELEVDYHFSDDLNETGEGKGVKEGGITFKRHDGGTAGLPTWTKGVDYKIEYLSCSKNSQDDSYISNGQYHSEVMPVERGSYFARVIFLDGFVENLNYTLKDGRNGNGDPLDHVCEGAYVDKVYRIKPQVDISARIVKENSFDEGFRKVISLSFIYNSIYVLDSDVLQYDISIVRKDGESFVPVATYKLDAASSESDQAVKYRVESSEAGTYYVTYTFHKNTGYRIVESTDGQYTSISTEANYIREGDTITYTYYFIRQKQLKYDWQLGETEYYDGTPKTVDPIFEAERTDPETPENSTDAYVNLIRSIHYSIRYYVFDAEKNTYSLMGNTDKPYLPGKYIAELVFETDIPDYCIEGSDGFRYDLRMKNFTYYKDNKLDANAPRLSFTIEKAQLILKGISISDKPFDGTTDVVWQGRIAFEAEKGKGAIVADPTYEGSLIAHFESDLPGEHSIVYDESAEGFFSLSAESAVFYDIPVKKTTVSATITPAVINVYPKEVRQQYDDTAIDNSITFTAVCSDDILALFEVSDASELLKGELYRESGISVRQEGYNIYSDRLGLSSEIKFNYKDVPLAELVTLNVVLQDKAGNTVKYYIVKRQIELSIVSASKYYGESDPDFTKVSDYLKIGEGYKLVDGDTIIATIYRDRNNVQSVGSFDIVATNIRIINSVGGDVTANYDIEIDKDIVAQKAFTIKPRTLIISPPSQHATYVVGFNAKNIGVTDENNKNVTDRYYTNPLGDHFIGELSYEETDDPYVFVIKRGTVRMVNLNNENVSANYDIRFINDLNPSELRTYTIDVMDVRVKINSDAILTKIYGDPDPVIRYTITDEAALGRYLPVSGSSIGRVGRGTAEGENVGEYDVLRSNTGENNSFIVLDSGKNISRYFNFIVENMDENNPKRFVIKPRPVTVTVENATYENTGIDPRPVVTYLNASGDKLSATLLSMLKVRYGVVSGYEYQKGENVITPVVISEAQEDENFDITVKDGVITIVYLQDVVSVTSLSEEDEFCVTHKNVLSGIMLYKSVRYYKLNTGNGEQPSEKVNISLPIDNELKGSGFVAVAIYADGSSKAFSLTQEGRSLVYSDDDACYVVIAEVQEWFYLIWGVVIIVGGLALFFLGYLIVNIAKKQKAKAQTPEKLAAKAQKDALKAEKKAARDAAKQAKKEEKEAAAAKKRPVAQPVAPVEASETPSQSNEVELEVELGATEEVTASSDADVVSMEVPLDPNEVGIAPEDSAPESEELAVAEEEPVAAVVEDVQETPTIPIEESKPTLGQSVFVPAAALTVTQETELSKEEKKAQREQERAEKKEKERAEKERLKREKEEEKARREETKKNQKKAASSSERPTSFVPSSFMPKTSATDAPKTDEYDLFTKPAAKNDDLSVEIPLDSDEIEIPLSGDNVSDDDLVLSKSTSMFTDEDENEKQNDDDLI